MKIVCCECGYKIDSEDIKAENVVTLVEGFNGKMIRKQLACPACSGDDFYIITKEKEEKDNE